MYRAVITEYSFAFSQIAVSLIISKPFSHKNRLKNSGEVVGCKISSGAGEAVGGANAPVLRL